MLVLRRSASLKMNKYPKSNARSLHIPGKPGMSRDDDILVVHCSLNPPTVGQRLKMNKMLRTTTRSFHMPGKPHGRLHGKPRQAGQGGQCLKMTNFKTV